MNANVIMLIAVTASLAGCAMQPAEEQADEGEEQVDESNVAEVSRVVTSVPVASDDSVFLAHGLDGRAAEAAEAKALGTLAITPSSAVSSWPSGSVAPGGTQHWFWNNSSLTAAYKVGLAPFGASTAAPCEFQVTRTWDVQQNTSEREFHFVIQNVSTITCGTTILLASQENFHTLSTGGIDPGASQHRWWNNANPLTAAHLVGISPIGSTSSHTCDMEVTPTWYLQQPSTAEREFHYVVTNIGAIACEGTVLLAMTTNADSSWPTGTINPGASKSWVWNNANPVTRVYVPGLSPLGASGSSTCQLEITSTSYQQLIRADGTSERRFFLTVKNIGSLACSGTVLLNNLG